ncbi:DUF2865 domain-containing protein [Roseibium aestuarii]|uniref:DUF2865 domain-containing protein n=1 Tax=Roseibium aestuarii TaxID=2600299 RepID=A0ABW4JRU7_9HYPH|nr:DUF2865 domain-containing protein [Roseibium aestuarii]
MDDVARRGSEGRSRQAASCLTGVMLLSILALMPAAEAAGSCDDLRQQLARLERSGGPDGQAKWQAEHDRQAEALTAAERDAHHLNCGGGQADARCGPLTQKMERMRRNRRAIDRQLAKAAGTGKAKSIARLQTRLQAAGCGGKTTTEASSARNSRPGGLLGVLLGSRARVGDGLEETAGGATSAPVSRSTGQSSRAGMVGSGAGQTPGGARFSASATYRTLCVRQCDGYFFPLSYKTTRRQFSQDAFRCSEVCPGAETELFVHRNPGGAAEDMVSLSGQPYDGLTNAWRYRSERVENCSCRPLASRTGANELRLGSAGATGALRVLQASPGHVRAVIGGVGDENGDVTGSSVFGRPERPDAVGLEVFVAAPLPGDELSPDLDPASRLDLLLGFDSEAALLQDPAQTATRTVAGAQGADQRMPVGEPGLTPDAAPQPVFTIADEPVARPDPDRPVRVVGPEYFVAR